MKYLFDAGKLLLVDLASTILFLVVFMLTENVALAVVLGMALGVGQVVWRVRRREPIDTIQWLSFAIVLGFGTATLLTNDPRFVMIKPTLIYMIVGVVMLKPGWMNRYLPPVALEVVPDLAYVFGFVWAGLMFLSAALNLILALNFSILFWGAFMSAWGIASKAALMVLQWAVMRFVGRRRRANKPLAAPPAAG
jgi:intracellular septation protein A